MNKILLSTFLLFFIPGLTSTPSRFEADQLNYGNKEYPQYQAGNQPMLILVLMVVHSSLRKSIWKRHGYKEPVMPLSQWTTLLSTKS